MSCYYKATPVKLWLFFFLSFLYRLNILLAGMNPFYFHAVNVILHCLVTLVLMYTCDKAVFKDCRLAFVTALFFAVHPIHTEAVSMRHKMTQKLKINVRFLSFFSFKETFESHRVWWL